MGDRLGEENRKRLGIRIQEILDEYKARGVEPRNQRDLAKRIGHSNHMRIHRMIKGEYIRGLSITDYEQVAKGLGIGFSRLLMEDVAEEREALELLLENRWKMADALALAAKLTDVAIGATEKCRAYNYLGQVYSILGQSEEATNAFEKAWQQAKEMKGTSQEIYSAVFVNLCMEYYQLQRNDQFFLLLEEMEGTATDETVFARIFHMRGLYYAGLDVSHDVAIGWFLRALEIYDKRGEKRAVGRIYHNLAEACFRMRHLEKALAYHQKARIYLVADNMESRCRSDKDFAKTLYLLGHKKEAIDLLEMRLHRLGEYSNYGMIAKLLLLYAELTQDPKPIEGIFEMLENIPRDLQLHAADLRLRLLLQEKNDQTAYQIVRESSSIAEKKKFYEEVWF